MVLLCGLLHLFLFVSNAKADPDSWGLVKRVKDALIYEPPLTQVENASKRNCHKKREGGRERRVTKAGYKGGLQNVSVEAQVGHR